MLCLYAFLYGLLLININSTGLLLSIGQTVVSWKGQTSEFHIYYQLHTLIIKSNSSIV